VKTITIILAAYIMGISMIPCSEVIQECLFDGAQRDLTELKSQLPNDRDGGVHDHCSPFCVCDCCGATIWTMENPLAAVDKLTAPCSTPSIFKTLLSNPDQGDIWQPPKNI
jgi:Family of unknown function (DUF6660)